jgi:hypothetical protein
MWVVGIDVIHRLDAIIEGITRKMRVLFSSTPGTPMVAHKNPSDDDIAA